MANLSVTGYKDNPDGTTTNYLSDGSQDTGTYSKNSDGSLNFNPQFNGVINASQLTSPNFQFKAPTLPDNTQLYKNSLSGLSSLAQSNIAADEAFQASQDKAQQLSQNASSIEQLRNAITGKEAYSQQQAQALGVNTAQDKLTDVNKQILALNAQVNNIPLQGQQEAMGRGRTDAGQSVLDTAALRNASIQGNILTAQQAAAKLDLETAKQKVTDAVNLKYKDQEDLLKAKEASFDLNQKLYQSLSANQKDAWDRAKYANEQEQKKLEEKKKNEEAIQNMIVEATPNAPASMIANARKLAESGASKLAVAQSLGIYGGDYLKNELLKEELKKTKAETTKLYSDIAAKQAIPTSIDGVIQTLPKVQQDRYYKLQGDFDKATEKYRGAVDAASSLSALAENATAQDQTAIIFQYMKTLDPSSTVREGEFALVAGTAGLGDRAINALKRLDNGQRLNKTQINEIVGAANKLADSSKSNLKATESEYDRRAKLYGLPNGLFNRSNVVSQEDDYVTSALNALQKSSNYQPNAKTFVQALFEN